MKNSNLEINIQQKVIKASIVTTIVFIILFLSNCSTDNNPNTEQSQLQNNTTSTQINDSDSIFFDVKNLKSSSSSKNIDDKTGYISNQFWITTIDLSQDQLLSVIKKYDKLKVVAYRESMGGYLIEIDELDKIAQHQISSIKMESGVLSVYNNTFVGKNIKRTY